MKQKCYQDQRGYSVYWKKCQKEDLNDCLWDNVFATKINETEVVKYCLWGISIEGTKENASTQEFSKR